MTAIRERERVSIRAFLEMNRQHFKDADVLDFGCGAQPYRHLIEEAGALSYTGHDDVRYPAHVVSGRADLTGHEVWDMGDFDVVVCTQVIQYVDVPWDFLVVLRSYLKPGGLLLLTGPTNWPIVEDADRWRFTVSGIHYLLASLEFEKLRVDVRAVVQHDGETWPLGWMAEAWRPA